MVGLDGFEVLFQPKWFYDTVCGWRGFSLAHPSARQWCKCRLNWNSLRSTCLVSSLSSIICLHPGDRESSFPKSGETQNLVAGASGGH